MRSHQTYTAAHDEKLDRFGLSEFFVLNSNELAWSGIASIIATEQSKRGLHQLEGSSAGPG